MSADSDLLGLRTGLNTYEDKPFDPNFVPK